MSPVFTTPPVRAVGRVSAQPAPREEEESLSVRVVAQEEEESETGEAAIPTAEHIELWAAVFLRLVKGKVPLSYDVSRAWRAGWSVILVTDITLAFRRTWHT